MEDSGGPRTPCAVRRIFFPEKLTNENSRIEDEWLVTPIAEFVRSAECARVREQQQLRPQPPGAWIERSCELWLCGPLLLQHLRTQQASEDAEDASPSGTKIPTNESSSRNLAVRRRIA